MDADVSTYKLKASNGRHIRLATAVTFPDGRVVRFIDRLGKREAIRQAAAVRELDEGRNNLDDTPCPPIDFT